MKHKFIKNKTFYLIVFITFLALIYTHSNTFLSNDDLPYMYLYRTSERVSTLLDIIKNQYADYFNVNGRIFVHSLLQLTLIFDKKAWTIINPIMIISSIVLLINIVKIKNKQTNVIISFLLGVSLYLLLFKFKHIIYWVAGSVNYVWVSTFLFLFVYLYYKKGFSKKKYLNMIIIFILSAIHESTMVFTIIFIAGNMLYDYTKNKKFNKDYLLYLLSLSGALILFLSPSNQLRLVSDELWNSLGFLAKIKTSIPVISKDLLNLTSVYQPLSYIYIFSVLYLLLKNKTNYLLSGLILTNIILIYIFPYNWLYFSLVMILFISENYSHIHNKNIDFVILNTSIYATVYSNIISPTYAAGRPNYYFMMYIIFLLIYIINDILKSKQYSKKIIYIFSAILFSLSISYEIYIYHNIGMYHQIRLNEIKEFKKTNSTVLKLIKIPNKYAIYHIDPNLPDNSWFTYNYFRYYYELPENIIIEYID